MHAQCELLIHRLDHPVRMQSRLTVLYLFASAEVAKTAEYAWFALSRACHHHAYELAPTASELLHLLSLVKGLADAEKRLRLEIESVEPREAAGLVQGTEIGAPAQ